MKKLTSYFEETLLSVLCHDKSERGAKAVRALVPVKSYSPFFRELAEAADAYIETYGEPPGDHTIDLIEELKSKRPDSKEVYDRLLGAVNSTWSVGVNSQYVLDSAAKFVRRQRLKAALLECTRILQRDEPSALDEAESLLSKTIKGSVEVADPGLLFNDPEQALRFLDRARDDVLPTGIKELDDHDLGPVRGGLWLFLAPMGRGKSWNAVHQGCVAITHGKRTLHITLEMSVDKVAQRYAQRFASVGKRPAKETPVRRFRKDELGRSVGFEDDIIRDRPNLQQEDIRAVLRKKLEPLKWKSHLRIKQFPTGTLTVKALRSFLEWLESAEGFVPELIIVDYLGLMDIDPKYQRTTLGKVAVDLRGLAVERSVFMATYGQTNRDSLKSKVIGLDKTAEDISLVATADTVITFNQTDTEQKFGLARLFVAKARDDAKHFQVLISQCYALGQFVLDSAFFSSGDYWTDLEGEDETPRTGKRTKAEPAGNGKAK